MTRKDPIPPISIETLWNLPASQFLETAKLLCAYQANHNPVYKQWITLSKQTVADFDAVNSIPFLPISFFKNQDVYIGEQPATLFESSGTTQDVVSKHWVADTNLYESSFLHCFELFYGSPKDYCIIGLLPSYLERQHSSLVYMVEKLIQLSGHPQSGFYLNEFEKLDKVLKQLEDKQTKTWFIGVSFGLIDFSSAFPQKLKYATVIETGGMKGRREELTKEALHSLLQSNLGVPNIHSEYGMTELLSQAYSLGDGRFSCPPWMKVLVGEEVDPTALKIKGRGVLHIIDLANIYSCSFIATQDMGEIYEDGTFKVLGRVDNSDRRGCSLLAI
jgi:phenylacetate-coenzyme A ligase PaaK-like adenylate-forming protein